MAGLGPAIHDFSRGVASYDETEPGQFVGLPRVLAAIGEAFYMTGLGPRPLRLMVRTSGFQPENRGSIPLGGAMIF
jgi:hypothetical protein